MITGTDIRRYRELIGLNQRAFAQRIGLTQSALSLMEIGKQAVSEQHLAKIADAFGTDEFTPPFTAFQKQVEEELARGHGALTAPLGRFLTLPVYTWEPGFDLRRPPRPDMISGLVCIPFTADPAIAFRMPQTTDGWDEGEILVFRRCGRDEVKDNDLCLAQIKARGQHTKTMITQVHVSRAPRGRAVHLQPLSPAGAMLAADDTILAYLRLVFRAQSLA